MSIDKKTGKKDIASEEEPEGLPAPFMNEKYTKSSEWKQHVLQDKLSNGQHDSLALKTGEKIDEIRRLVVVDVDNKPARRVLRDEIAPPGGNRPGMELMERLCDEYNYTPHTWVQQSPNGYHIFYKVREEEFARLSTGTKVTYDGTVYDVDIRANNGLIFVYPTRYKVGNKTHKYRWNDEYKPGICELEIMPDFMINVFSKEPRRIIPRMRPDEVTPIEEISTLCSIIDDRHWDDRDTWIKLGTAMKSANDSEECAHLFEKYSGKSPKYKPGEPLRLWRSFDTTRVSKGTLMYFARQSDPLKYFEHFRNHRNELLNTNFLENEDILSVKTNYLMAENDILDDTRPGTDDQNQIKDVLQEFVTGDSKILAIRSHMGSGKTHTTREIIKNIGHRITKFGPNGIVDEVKPCTVLWITHRRSFANDLYNNFLQIGFKSYLEKEHKTELYKHDRVICSFESLHLLIRDGTMKKFDLVVLDETESLLAHFESPTMKVDSWFHST